LNQSHLQTSYSSNAVQLIRERKLFNITFQNCDTQTNTVIWSNVRKYDHLQLVTQAGAIQTDKYIPLLNICYEAFTRNNDVEECVFIFHDINQQGLYLWNPYILIFFKSNSVLKTNSSWTRTGKTTAQM